MWLVGWQLKVEDEVSRVTRGGERTITREHLVNRAIVDAGLRLDTVLHWQEVNHRHLDEELLRLTLLELFRAVIPLAAFQVQAVKIAASLGLLLDVFIGHRAHHDVTEADLIDSNCVLSREVLLRTREESLWEEES